MRASAALVCSSLAIAAPGFGQQHSIYYFDQSRDLELNPIRIAVFDGADAAQNAIDVGALRRVGVDDLQNGPISGWLLGQVAPVRQSIQGIEQLVAEAAAANSADFISPVFVDDFGGPLVVTRDIFVKFGPGVDAAAAEQIIGESGAGAISERNYRGLKGVYKLQSGSRSGFAVLNAANALAMRPDVVFAEPDMIFTGVHHGLPNDPQFDLVWGVHNTGQPSGCGPTAGTNDIDMNGPEAWDIEDGDAAIRVVIIDSGYQLNHPDINHSGFGADFTGEGGAGAPVHFCDRHGTAVAGCVSGIINNATDGAGIAPGCTVASARPFVPNEEDPPCSGNWTTRGSWTADALTWALNTAGCRVSNNSNGYGFTSALIDTAYTDTRNAGMVHFASAGNNGTTTVGYPANLATVNAISAINKNGNLAGFSDSGPGLDFCGPGVDVLTTDRTGTDGYGAGDTTCIDGTSFASPYASGVAALVLSVDPSMTPTEVEQILAASVKDLGAAGYDETFGHGLVNAAEAVLSALGCTTSDHNCFTTGGPGCTDTDCCQAVCDIDPFCCDTEWDGICVGEASNLCNGCGDPAIPNCFTAHGEPFCNDRDCCESVCAIDPFCCDIQWDGICANEASELCDGCGDPEAGDCCRAHSTPYCNDRACCDAVCAADPFCCDIEWDSICVSGAVDLCQALCDCNDNDIADNQELSGAYANPSGQLTPVGDGYFPTYRLDAPLWAAGDVLLRLEAYGDFSQTGEYVTVHFNGWENEDEVGVAFRDNGNDCPDVPDVAQIVVPAAIFNKEAATGNVVILIEPSNDVNPFHCDPFTWISVNTQYEFTRDCNGNGTLDECDIAAGTSLDANGNGFPDECETWLCPADATFDGIVDIDDLLLTINTWGACGAPCPTDCAPPGGNGEVNVDDLLGVMYSWGPCP